MVARKRAPPAALSTGRDALLRVRGGTAGADQEIVQLLFRLPDGGASSPSEPFPAPLRLARSARPTGSPPRGGHSISQPALATQWLDATSFLAPSQGARATMPSRISGHPPPPSSAPAGRDCPECRSVKDDSLENRLAARNTEGTEEGGTEGFWRWSLLEGVTLRKHTPNTFPEAKTEKEKMPSERSPLPAPSVSPSSARSALKDKQTTSLASI